MSALDKLLASNRRDFTFGSHTVTAERVTDIFDAILEQDDVPLPALAEMEGDDDTSPAERSAAERLAALRSSRASQDRIVRRAVCCIDGEDVTLPDDIPLGKLFPTAVRREIADYAMWQDAEGKD